MNLKTPKIVRISHHSSESMLDHFLRLKLEDRRLRFGMSVSEEYIRKYVEGINFKRDTLYAIFDSQLRIVACSHLGIVDNSAELGLSVDTEFRSQGYGMALFERAIVAVKSKAIDQIYMVCLAENRPIMNMAKKLKMKVVTQYGDADAHLNIHAEPMEVFENTIQEKVLNGLALWDLALI